LTPSAEIESKGDAGSARGSPAASMLLAVNTALVALALLALSGILMARTPGH
jgi:hypothetical protein